MDQRASYTLGFGLPSSKAPCEVATAFNLRTTMHPVDLTEAVKNPQITRAKGPVAVLIAEDESALPESLAHLAKCGFKTRILVAPKELLKSIPSSDDMIMIAHKTRGPGVTSEIVNAIVKALPQDTWLYYGYNAEFLFYPFCETRSIGEMLTFHSEERRSAMLTYIIDVYAGDLGQAENGVALNDAMLDKSGYYALARKSDDGTTLERQLNFYGGLRWRFEDHIPEGRRRIDRIALARTTPGLTLNEDHTWSIPEYNTYACPWHHNLTAAIVSFRAAKALTTNPASRHAIDTFRWHNSTEFTWHSRQLLDLGLMEPGQWF